MSWRKITCAERDAIFHAERIEKLRPIDLRLAVKLARHVRAGCGTCTWGLHSTDTPVLRESRYPSRDGGQDRKPCEHWEFREDGW